MKYKDAGSKQETIDTIIPPVKTISRDLFIAKTYYDEANHEWAISGTLIPKSNTLTVNIYMKIVDENGNGRYYMVNSPHIGLVN